MGKLYQSKTGFQQFPLLFDLLMSFAWGIEQHLIQLLIKSLSGEEIQELINVLSANFSIGSN